MTINRIIGFLLFLVSIVFLSIFFTDLIIEIKDFILDNIIEILLFVYYFIVLLTSLGNNYLWVPNGYDIYKKDTIRSKCIRLPFLIVLIIVIAVLNEFTRLLTIFIILELIYLVSSVFSRLLEYKNPTTINGNRNKETPGSKTKLLDKQLKDQIIFKLNLLLAVFIVIIAIILFSVVEQSDEVLESMINSLNGLSVFLLILVIYRTGSIVYSIRTIVKMSKLEAKTEAEYREHA